MQGRFCFFWRVQRFHELIILRKFSITQHNKATVELIPNYVLLLKRNISHLCLGLSVRGWSCYASLMSTNSLCLSSPGTVTCVTGGRSKGPALAIRMPDLSVVLPSAQVLTQHSVGLVQLHKLAVQCRVGWVTVWVQLHVKVKSMKWLKQTMNKYPMQACAYLDIKCNFSFFFYEG